MVKISGGGKVNNHLKSHTFIYLFLLLFTYDSGLPTYFESAGRRFESCRARHFTDNGISPVHLLCTKSCGGTFDIALAQSTAGRVNLLDHGGIAMCGGCHWDRRLADEIAIPWLL
jgi:hypothetical protein